MSKRLNVGRSWRTPAKHELMRNILGKEVGATGYMRDVHRLVWLDLTAGDGAPVDGEAWHKACSPGILAYYATGSSKPVNIALYEIAIVNYDRLLNNLAEHLPNFGYIQVGEDAWRHGDNVSLRAIHESGHLANIDFIRAGDAVFVLNDPNAITEWAMRDSLAQEISRRTWLSRTLSTMGCNTAGLKRLDPDDRISWFDLIEAQQAALPGHRDLLLAAIEKDEAQWAYLISTPVAWREKTEAVVNAAFKRQGRTTAKAWLGVDLLKFQDLKLQLFLTRPERDRIRGDEGAWMLAPRAKRLEMIRAAESPEAPNEGDEPLTLF